MYSALKLLGLATGLAAVAQSHTVMTTMFINEQNQGDGVCVRMPKNGQTATNPIASVTSNDMVCGRDGTQPVPFTCAAPANAKLTFWFRSWPDYTQPGSIDTSHMGPCAIYLKQVSSASSTSGSGGGWFKIWEQGYDSSSNQWCTEKVAANQGFLSMNLPPGLPRGDYLVRTELLALHESTRNDPQFYVNCAQIHVQGDKEGTLQIGGGYEASIPGYVSMSSTGLKWDVWNKPGDGYETPGPSVFNPSSSTSGLRTASGSDNYAGGIPSDCLVANGNWCGKEVDSYSSEAGCWSSSSDCWAQNGICFDTAMPMGYKNCQVWQRKCEEIEAACSARRFTGPPKQGQKLQRVDSKVPRGVSFAAWAGGSGGGNGWNEEVTTAEVAAVEEDVVYVTDEPMVEDELPGLVAVEIEEEEPQPQEVAVVEEVVPVSSPEAEPVMEEPANVPAPVAEETAEEHDYDEYDYEDEAEEKEEDEDEDDYETEILIESEPESSDLAVSLDGRCGGSTGQTCDGSEFGACCSKKGRCGGTRRHCACGCLGGFGKCNPVRSSMHEVFDDYNEW